MKGEVWGDRGRTKDEATPGRSFGFGAHVRVRGSSLVAVFLKMRRIVVEVVRSGGRDGDQVFVSGLHDERNLLQLLRAELQFACRGGSWSES